MHGAEDGEKNPNGLTDFLDFHGLLPTPTARDWKGAPTLEHFARKGKNPQQGSLPDFFAQAGRSFQLNPLFVAETVSYTHLDVYKRQSSSRGHRPVCRR